MKLMCSLRFVICWGVVRHIWTCGMSLRQAQPRSMSKQITTAVGGIILNSLRFVCRVLSSYWKQFKDLFSFDSSRKLSPPNCTIYPILLRGCPLNRKTMWRPAFMSIITTEILTEERTRKCKKSKAYEKRRG